jgi:hypothetical protein
MAVVNRCRTAKSAGCGIPYGVRLEAGVRQRPTKEVVMEKVLGGVMAVAMLAAFAVAGAMAGDRLGTRHRLVVNWPQRPLSDSAVISRGAGMMPEVVVTAEKPRLVMPTVEVRAGRTMAMSGPELRIFSGGKR